MEAEFKNIEVSAEDRAYLAGLFDGEGSAKVYDKYPGRSQWVQVVINMSDKDPVELAHRLYGGSINFYANHVKGYWSWHLGDKSKFGNGVLLRSRFLNDILPYMHNESKIKDVKALLKYEVERPKKFPKKPKRKLDV